MASSRVTVVSLNVQGLNWQRQDQLYKLRALVTLIRTQPWDVVCLSEVHSTDSAVGDRHIVYIEDLMFIFSGTVGLALTMKMRMAWHAVGDLFDSEGDRACSAIFTDSTGIQFGILVHYGVTEKCSRKCSDARRKFSLHSFFVDTCSEIGGVLLGLLLEIGMHTHPEMNIVSIAAGSSRTRHSHHKKWPSIP